MIPPAHPETISTMGSSAGRLRRGFNQLRGATSTWILVRILVIVQAVPVIWDRVSPGALKLTLAQDFLGLTKAKFLGGDLWQVLSYAVIHGNWLHLALNALAIILLGSKLEHIIVKRSYWLLCLYAALAGGLMFLLFSPFGNSQADSLPHQTLVGSSAICFAFLVLLTTLSPDSKFLPVFLSGKTVGIAIILANLILALLNPDLPTGPLARYGEYLSKNGLTELFKVSHACHFGGALTGWLYGKYLLRPRVTLKSLRRAREKTERSKPGSPAN